MRVQDRTRKVLNTLIMQNRSKLHRESESDIRTWLRKCDAILFAETGKHIPELKVNLKGQRDISQTWLTSVVNLAAIHLGFYFGKFDPIKINRLPDGSINIPDGQHRLIAIQYLWKELIDSSIEVPYFAQYVKYLFHNEINVHGFDQETAREIIFDLASGQTTIRRGDKIAVKTKVLVGSK